MDFVQNIDDFIGLAKLSVDEYSINYSANKKFEKDKFKSRLVSADGRNIESLRLDRFSDNTGVFLSSEFKYLGLENVFELNFVSSLLGGEFQSMFKSLSSRLAEIAQVLYGYGRELSSNIDPTTENVFKRNLFGNVSVKVDKATDIWLESPSHILDGAAKGIYCLNLLSSDKLKSRVFEKLLKSVDVKIETMASNLDLVSISNNQLHEIEAANPEIARFVRM